MTNRFETRKKLTVFFYRFRYLCCVDGFSMTRLLFKAISKIISLSHLFTSFSLNLYRLHNGRILCTTATVALHLKDRMFLTEYSSRISLEKMTEMIVSITRKQLEYFNCFIAPPLAWKTRNEQISNFSQNLLQRNFLVQSISRVKFYLPNCFLFGTNAWLIKSGS